MIGNPLLGALEGGGTKMVCAVGYASGAILKRESIPTTTPEETLPKLARFFQDEGVEALGIGSFGPVDLREGSDTYGYITSTPKPGWADTPFMPVLRDALNVPVGFETDVNLAAIGEYTLGAGRGLANVVYVTVGTGIGAGIIIDNKPLHGLVHSEMGHLLLKPSADETHPDGFCPYHKGCLEGLASGPAIEKRWGEKAGALPPDHPAWALEAEYLAQCCANMIVAISPERIILGGGVMHQTHLFEPVRRRTLDLLGGYIRSDKILDDIDHYIVPPGLGDNSGTIGGLILAARQLQR
ncbi:MAG: ROK family protein [Oscillospiraceae bacterium]|jgi:fructokinase|nr:ROK family protein [Oscillospiraceae bacterium]